LYHGCNDGSRLCGIGYDITGFYCCPVGAAIARIFRLNVVVKTVADLTVKRLIEQYEPLCSKCGCYAYYKVGGVDRNIISPTWNKAIREYNALKKHRNETR
jgi:hypothetical protein